MRVLSMWNVHLKGHTRAPGVKFVQNHFFGHFHINLEPTNFDMWIFFRLCANFELAWPCDYCLGLLHHVLEEYFTILMTSR